MTPESKRKLLEAFDALSAIEVGRFGGVRKNTHGGSAGCDFCGISLASGTGHLDCPIGAAKAAIMPLIPPFPEREKWLAAP